MNTAFRSMALTTVLVSAAVSAIASPASRGGVPGCVPALVSAPALLENAGAPREAAATWICDRADNICGLDDARMLSKPAKVDYDALLKATAEMKKMRDDKIDPNSSEGIQLRQRAVDRIRDKADSVRQAQGYCSVWKTISHKDGRTIPDITDLVKAQL
jgi:hypothetical protein